MKTDTQQSMAHRTIAIYRKEAWITTVICTTDQQEHIAFLLKDYVL